MLDYVLRLGAVSFVKTNTHTVTTCTVVTFITFHRLWRACSGRILLSRQPLVRKSKRRCRYGVFDRYYGRFLVSPM